MPSVTVSSEPQSLATMATTKVEVNANETFFEGKDREQIRLMGEMCILVDENDKPIGYDTKVNCHLMKNIEKGLLHRAFSVFLFDSQGRLLIQQRAAEKITFPNMWTNTCCSHPLDLPLEIVEENQSGVREAARRKLQHELGIPMESISADEFTYLTRIYYKAASDSTWGEHEIDYILFLQKDVGMEANPNEVSDTNYVTAEELKQMMQDADDGKITLTPWFRHICDTLLFKWWSSLKNGEGLAQFTDHENIQRF
eukprot:Clim_evm12s203 gene=Clim_evmTU12s203